MSLARSWPTITNVSRPDVFKEYIENMSEYLVKSKGLTKEQAVAAVRKMANDKMQDPMVDVVTHRSTGNSHRSEMPLSKYIRTTGKQVLTPNGATYTPTAKKKAFVGELIEDGLATRKKIKHKQFAAKAAGDKALERSCKFAQSNIKIILNSLPGGFGSAYNLFYDKVSYNTITSVCRCFIAHSYATAEILLGGNWPLFNEKEVLNHIVINTRDCPPPEKVMGLLAKYQMKSATKEQLYEYFVKIVAKYEFGKSLDKVKHLIDTLQEHELNFLYYLGNLRHIVWDNEHFFRPLIEDLLSTGGLDTSNISVDEFGKFDGDIEPVLLTVMNHAFNGVDMGDMKEKNPEGAKQVVAYNKKFLNFLDYISELMYTFVYIPNLVPMIMTRKNMSRNTVVISDTDSVIFTSKDWVIWYEGQIDTINQRSYDISALVTYFLTRVNADTMEKFSVTLGSTGEGIYRMQMKNEYLYPSLLLYSAKKVYAGIIKIQEGVIMDKADPDLKGGALRSSKIAQRSKDFIQDFIVNDILNTSLTGKLSIEKLVGKVVNYEGEIKKSLAVGDIEFLDRQNVKTAGMYADPSRTAYVYAEAWNYIFGAKHDVVNPPEKQAKITILPPTPEYWTWLQENHPKTYVKFNEFIQKYGKAPKAFVMSATCRKIPEEIIPLIDVRGIIYNNLNPVYITLERLNIATGHKKKKVILSDIY